MGISQGFVQEKQNVLKMWVPWRKINVIRLGHIVVFFFAWIAMLDKSNNNLAK